jgi:hypothetical protein
MDQNTSLFGLSIDYTSKTHLTEAAKWARFLAIVGMIFLALILFAGLYLSITLASLESDMEGFGRPRPMIGAGIGSAFVYVVIAVIWFFPLFYLLRFSTELRKALDSENQEILNAAFQSLKVCLRYLGIVTIIVLVIYALIFVIGIMTFATMS